MKTHMDTLQSRMLKFYKSFREGNFAHFHSFMQLCPKSPRCWPQFFPWRDISEALVFCVVLSFYYSYYFIIMNWRHERTVFGYTYEAKESNTNLLVVPQSQCGHILITTSKCSA